MNTIPDIETAIAAWLKKVAGGRQIVKGRIGEAPAPNDPFIMYALEDIDLPNSVESKILDDGTQMASAPDTTVTFVLEVVGDMNAESARAAAARLQLTLYHSQRTADIFGSVGFWSVGSAQNLSGLEVGAMRQRFRIPLVLSAKLAAFDAPETIEQVDLGIHELTIPHDIEITVNQEPQA